MCGIAGGLFQPGDALAEAAVAAMSDRMRNRGPDASGAWADPERGVHFGHRRLSIIDLDERANQPFLAADGRHAIVFNGEIYNYLELREELVQGGARLRTRSDTEVVLELFRRSGPRCFARLRGMFALAIWDGERDELVLARDPYGIKPLYVGRARDGAFLFASQVKALLASGRISPTTEPAGVAGFYIWGSIPEPFTLYQDIEAVPAGSFRVFRREAAGQAQVYADVAGEWTRQANAPDIGERVREALRSSVEAHLVADVPVAVLLSGGADSGAIAGLAADAGPPPHGVTICFDEFEGGPRDEVPRAREVATGYGMAHSVRRVTAAEFEGDKPLILDAMDQPTIDGVNAWFASKAVAEQGFKVALSGIGGDELRGYAFKATALKLLAFGRTIGAGGGAARLASPVFALAARLSGKPKLAAIPQWAGTLEGAYMLRRSLLTPPELTEVMPREMAKQGLERLAASEARSSASIADGPAGLAALESVRYLRNQLLRDADWASMAHSVELRTPLVDWPLLHALAPYAAQMAGEVGKNLIAEAPSRPLPASVVEHPKTGFGLPIDAWLNQAEPNTPAVLSRPWARRWAWSVAEAFGFAGANV